MAAVHGRSFNRCPARADATRVAAAALLLCLACTLCARAAEPCEPALGRVVSVQGKVELRRGSAAWTAVELNTPLCTGDTLRVHQHSRAALLLSNETTLRLDQGTILTLAPPDAGKATLMEQLSGGLHVITRTPKAFRVKTPFVNANVEGTEFLVRVDESNASVAVYEGHVVADNDVGSVTLTSGEQAVAAINGAPRKEVVIRPKDAVTWTLYFPTIFDYRLGAGLEGDPRATALQRSIDLYRGGKVADALAALDNVPEGAATPRFLTYRAGLLLLVGRLDEARPEIERALLLDPSNADAYSLLTIVAVAENDKDKALELAEKAVDLDPTSPTPLLARSYAQQANFRVEDALESARGATKLDESNALSWARVAELELSVGNLDEALDSARRAVALDQTLARTQTVLGFANLLRIDTKAAKEAFQEAIERDQVDPLPRLGIGLAKIREGDLTAGREEIEIAASLDPGNSLIRSYLGKAYYEEKRNSLAGRQFDVAKVLDSSDPTPYFYDAIRSQSENDPVAALRDINVSIALNNNRSVYRSALRLDDDKATRTTGASNIYGELGFERLAIVESSKALAYQFGNDSAHRQLAIAYRSLPRHDIARVSESLQAQLRQPLTASPLSPQITTDNLVTLRDTGPSKVGDNEFNLLFNRNQTRGQLDTAVGSHGILSDQILISGLSENVAYAVSQFHYENAGFRTSSDLKKDIYDLFLQTDLSTTNSIQIELKRTNFELSQVFNAYDPDPDISSPVRTAEKSDSIRLGGRYTNSESSNWIYSIVHEERMRSAFDLRFNTLVSQIGARSANFELQNLLSLEQLQLIFGVRSLNTRDIFFQQGEITNTSTDFYIYGTWNFNKPQLTIQSGFSHDNLVVTNTAFENQVKRRRLSPKFGIVWSPRPDTTVRFSLLSSMKRRLVGNQTIEPTQLAGFNQFFTGFDSLYGDRDGTISNRACIGYDSKMRSNIYFGGEITARHMTVPSFILGRDFPWKERTGLFYLYRTYPDFSAVSWFSKWSMTTSAQIEFERIDRPAALTDVEGIRSLKTYYIPLSVKFFSNRGWSIDLSTTYVKQSSIFQLDEGSPEFPKNATGWTSDVSVHYRLPARRGLISLGFKNIFNRAIDLFETDPVNPQIARGRIIFLKARLLF